MMFGLSLAQLTYWHVVISFLGIAFGLVVIGGLVIGRQSATWTAIFLLFTVLTTVTGLFTAILANWFNSFVFVVQTFEKVPVLKAMSPPSPAFPAAQAIVLGLHVLFVFAALRKFRPDLATAA